MGKPAGLFGAICGSLLVGLPVIAMPRIKAELPLSQTNPNPSILNEAPYNRGTSSSPLNPSPGIFNEPPYNRRPGSSPSSPAIPDGIPPSPPVTLTFKRDDGGLLMVSPQASSESGMLEVTFTETTDLTTDRTTMTVQKTGAVFLN